MIDLNLTGSVSLIQPSTTNYMSFVTQILTTLLTVGATLGGVWFKGYLDVKSEEKKSLLEQKDKRLEGQKNAYQDFLAEFSAPIPNGLENYGVFNKITTAQLKAALNAAEFGNAELNESIKVEELNISIQTLEDLIIAMFAVRFNPLDLDTSHRIRALVHISNISTEKFGALFLDYLMNGKEIAMKTTA